MKAKKDFFSPLVNSLTEEDFALAKETEKEKQKRTRNQMKNSSVEPFPNRRLLISFTYVSVVQNMSKTSMIE